MKIWKSFGKSRRVRILCFSLAGVLLIASAIGLGQSLSAPKGVAVPAASYKHTGKFDYLVCLKPNTLYGEFVPSEEAEEIPMIFFRDIIDEAQQPL